MADPINKLAGYSQPELRQWRQWNPPWYQRIPYAVTDAIYGPNANAQQAAPVINALGVNSPFNVPAQAQESGEMLGRGIKFGEPATAVLGALGAGLATMGLGRGRTMAPEGIGAARSAAAHVPEPKPQGITAYHGSPHDFDEFVTPAYFGNNEGIARIYKNSYGGRDNLNGLGGANAPDGWMAAATAVDKAGGDRARAIQELRDQASSWSKTKPQSMWDRLLGRKPEVDDTSKHLIAYNNQAADYLEKVGGAGPLGKMYEVRLPPPTHDIGDYTGSERAALAKAKRAGHKVVTIHGGEIVALDKDVIEILRKYGLVGMLGAGSAGSYASMPSEAQAEPVNKLAGFR